MGTKRTQLDKLEVEVAADFEKRRRKRRSWPEGGKSRIAKDVRARKRKQPPVPKNMSLAEVKELDPQDKRLRHKDGRPREYKRGETQDLPWKKAALSDKQDRQNKRRGKIRKHEAVVMKALEENSDLTVNSKVDAEEALIAEGVLTLDDWDDEELARGYRRNRAGRWGAPPKYIPREVAEEAFRRLVKRGDRHLRQAYLNIVKELIDLAHNSQSEKVRLEAIKELMNRTVGKVPEHLKVTPESPFQDFLADALEPVGNSPALLLDESDFKVKGKPKELGAGVAPSGGSRRVATGPHPVADVEAPAPNNSKRKKAAGKQKKKKAN